MTLIHSGNFKLLQKSENFLLERPEKINDNYDLYNIDFYTLSKNKVGLNVYKLECTNPGVVTIFQFMHQSSSTISLNSPGPVQNLILDDKDFSISLEANTRYSIQILNITGVAKIDMKDITGYAYYDQICTSYSNKATEQKVKHIKFTKIEGFFWFMSVINDSGQNIGLF